MKKKSAPPAPAVGLVMGSDSDWPLVSKAHETLAELGIPHEVRVMSAHRTPDLAHVYSATAEDRGLKVILAAAGGAAHLAGVLAAGTTLPVIGIPCKGPVLDGLDALLSTVQMPSGIPVATVAVGGGANADYLNQLTANRTGKTVYAGPTEATAIGNIVCQLLSYGVFSSVEEARACIFDSFSVKTFIPEG